MVTDAAVELAVRLLAGTDEELVQTLVTSWMWCEAHPEMPWVRLRYRKNAEVMRAVAGMLMDQPEAVALVRKLADTSTCRIHSDVRGGTDRQCFTHPGMVPCLTVSVRRTHIDSYRFLAAHAVGVSSGSLWMDELASPGRTAARYSRTGILSRRQVSTMERIAATRGPAFS